MSYKYILYDVDDRLATGIKAAVEERDKPFGGIVGRYPPVEEE